MTVEPGVAVEPEVAVDLSPVRRCLRCRPLSASYVGEILLRTCRGRRFFPSVKLVGACGVAVVAGRQVEGVVPGRSAEP